MELFYYNALGIAKMMGGVQVGRESVRLERGRRTRPHAEFQRSWHQKRAGGSHKFHHMV